MKTILHVGETTGPGGAETVFIQLATRDSGGRYRNLAAIPGPGWVADRLNAEGLAPLLVSISRSRPPLDVALYRSLVRLIRDHGVDLVHSHSLGISVYACIAGLRTRTPVICTLHGEVDLGRTARNRGIKLGIMRRGAAKIVLVSKRLRDLLLSESPIPAGKAELVYNGVDCDTPAVSADRSFRSEFGVPDDGFLVGSIGNIRAPKAYDDLLRAAAIAVKGNPAVRFAVVGEGSGALLDDLLRLRAELGLQDIVHFAGFRSNVAALLGQFDAFAMSSRSEGFPLAVVQAMASGRAIVATRCGGPEEQLTDGADGLLVAPADPAAMAAALLRLAGDAGLRERLGTAARTAARAKFSLEKMFESYDRIYDSALA